MVSDKTKPKPLTIGETIKKTINKTIVIGAAFTAAVILTPTAFARGPHEPAPRPSNGIQLAADIVNLVRAIVEPLPAPVVVTPTEHVVTKEVVTKEVVTVPGAVVVTETEVEIPEYSYILYEDEYIPYYEGWLYYRDVWHWVGADPRPAAPPRWAPPHRPAPDHHHKVIVLDHGPKPAPVVIRHEPPRRAPAPVVIRREAPRYEPPFATHHEAKRPEPARTVVVTTGRKDAAPGKAVVIGDRKPAVRADAPRNNAPKNKGR